MSRGEFESRESALTPVPAPITVKRPVLSANQASLWHCLRSAAVRTPIASYGNLLRL